MCHQHRLSVLQMCGSRNRNAGSLFGTVGKNSADLGKFLPQLIDCRPNIETQVSSNLLIAAAPAVQLVTNLADPRHELLFYEVMHVLSLTVVHKPFGSCCHLANLLQPF